MKRKTSITAKLYYFSLIMTLIAIVVVAVLIELIRWTP